MEDLTVKQLRDWCKGKVLSVCIDHGGRIIVNNEVEGFEFPHSIESLSKTILEAVPNPATEPMTPEEEELMPVSEHEYTGDKFDDKIGVIVKNHSVMATEDGFRAGTEKKYSAYFKDVRHLDYIDVYRVVDLFECEKNGHAISHAAKKLLLTGVRTGGKDIDTEIREAIDSLTRWLEMRAENRKANI